MQFPKVTCVMEKLAEREEGDLFLEGGCLSTRVGRMEEGRKTPGRGNGDYRGSEAGLGLACTRNSKNTGVVGEA